jgi:hypothetical protein
MSSLLSFRARAVIVVAAILLTSFASACCTCKTGAGAADRGKVLVAFDAVSNGTHAPPQGTGSNPKILGRIRFQGSVISFDVESQEAIPAQVEKLVVNWTSHVEGTSPIPFPVLDPNDPLHTYTIPFPSTDWYVVNIPATFDASGSNNCLHIRVDAYDHSGGSVTWGMKAYLPGLNTNWEQLKKP